MAQLDGLERRAGVTSGYDTSPERFSHLLEALHERSGQRVVVLIDEYDKPIIDALDAPDVARANRNYLAGLYSTLKFAGGGEIYLIGVEFSSDARNEVGFEVEVA